MDYNPTEFNKFIFLFIAAIFLFTKGIQFLLKNPGHQDVFAKVFILLIVAFVFANGIKRSVHYSEELWVQDPNSELITLNAAHNFAKKGLASDCGLPNFTKRYFYLDRENKDRLVRVPPSETPEPRPAYTHLPPGPWWIAGLFVKVCGDSTLTCPRILSTLSGSLALLFFSFAIYSALGPLRSIILLSLVAMIPMMRNMVYTLHYHNYAFSIFLVYLGFLIVFFKKKRAVNASTGVIFFVLGFVQGWVAYEYVFLYSISPITFALLYSQLEKKEDRKRLFWVISFTVLGFFSAVALHFIQNSLYFGGIKEAFNDLYERGKTRLLSDKPAGSTRKIDRISLSLEYFFVYPRGWFFFIVNFPILLSVSLVLIWFKEISITIKKPIDINLTWMSSRSNYFVILSAFIASYLWVVTMFNQVANEGPHMARILFFSYFICVLTILECITAAVPNNRLS